MIIFAGHKKPGQDGFYPGLFLNTDGATGADYLKFIADVVALVTKDKTALERMANAEGRTLNHPWTGVGSIPIEPE